MKKTVAVLLAVAMFVSMMVGNVPVINAATGTTYYVDSSAGDDAKDGTSEANAWKSIDKVNSTTFLAGDKILFKAGGTWNGQLWPKGSGVEGAPITIDKYGEGTSLPCINGLGVQRTLYSTGAVMLRNQEYWEINNLEVTNDDDFNTDLETVTLGTDGKATNIRDGILIINDADGDVDKSGLTMHHIYINNCFVHNVDSPNTWPGFANGGIIMHVVGTVDFTAAIVPVYSFDNIRIESNRIEKCDLLAIMNYNETTKTSFQDEISQFGLWHTNLYIGHNYMKDIGQGGIDICDAKNAVVEFNVLDGWSQRYKKECAGIYPWKSMNVIFQNNEVYNGPTDNDPHGDGTAFDFDSPNINILYQYNYTHNNPMGWTSYLGRSDNNIARYNISDNDGARIIRFGWFDNDSSPAYFLNNVFLFDGTKMDFSDYTDRFRGVDYIFNNNVFYDTNTSSTASSVWPSNYGTAKFSNNCFYTASGNHEANEPSDSKKITANPLFVNPGQAPTRDANGLLSGATVWDGYKLQSGSPLIDKGTYISQMGTRDFYGTELQYGAAPDIGVQEVIQGEKVTPNAPVVSENLAKNKTVTVQYSNASGANIVDGVKSTYWTSNTVDSQYVEIDFGKEETFNEIIASEYFTTPPTSGNYKPIRPSVKNYHYEKLDGSAWIKFYSSYGVGETKTDVFDSVTTSKIRMVIDDAMNTPRISEIQVYSDTGATPGENVIPSTPTIVPYNVIAHYSFDDVTATAVPDSSSNKLDGTKSASVTVSADGKLGSALYFGANGTKSDGYVSIANNALLNRSNLTISMWIKPDAYSLSKANEAIMLYSKGANGSECYSSTINTTDAWGDPVGGFQSPMILSASATANTKGARWYPTSTAGTTDLVSAGVWSQVVQTYDQHNYSIYVNGELYLSVPFSDSTNITNLYMNTDNLLIGNQSTSGKAPYFGYMDDVLILDQAITPNQVKALYAGNLDDTTAPAEATDLKVTAGNNKLILTWTDPTDTDFDYVSISGSEITAQNIAKGVQKATITGLTNGNSYDITVKTLDGLDNESTGVGVTGTPVTPQNLAKAKTVTVQYSNEGATTGANMVDGVKSTYWTSSTIDPQYVEIDFGNEETFNEVIASEYITTPPTSGNYKPVLHSIRNYHYEMWDGAAWVNFYVSYGIGETKKDVFPQVTTSKIRMVIDDAMNTPRICELQVYYDTGDTGDIGIAPLSSDPVEFNIISHYTFDNVNGSTVIDDSDNKLDGTKSASVTVSTDGKLGSALYFGANGTKSDGYVSVDNNDLLNRSNFSISMWVKPDAYSLSKANESIVLFSKGANGSECYSSTINTTDAWGDPIGGFQNPVILSTSTTANTKGARWYPTSTSGTTDLVQAGVWSQVVQTYDQHNYTIYVNGKLYMSVPISDSSNITNLYMNTANLLIGNQSTTGKSPYFGYMDDVLLLDQAITANQVKALYGGNLFDTTAPAEVTETKVTAGDKQLTLTWTDPADADFDHVSISGDGITTLNIAKGTQTATITDLTNGNAYSITVKAVDATGNVSTGVAVSGTSVESDTTAPAEVTETKVTAGDKQLTLTWTDSADTDFDHVSISGDGITTQNIAKGTQTATIKALTNGNAYSITVKAVDATGNVSIGVAVSGTPEASEVPDTTAPAEVTGVKVAAGNRQLILTWTDPADTDLKCVTITGAGIYLEVAAGVQIATISGLTNGIEYKIMLNTVDLAGNVSIGETVSGTPQASEVPDTTAPAEVTGVKVAAGNRQLILTWADPADADLKCVNITGAGIYLEVAAGVQTATISDLTNGIEYKIMLNTVDLAGNVSTTGAAISATPIAPATPVPSNSSSSNYTPAPKLNVTNGSIKVLELPKLDATTGEAKVINISKDDISKALNKAVSEDGIKKVVVEVPKVEGARAYVVDLPKIVFDSDDKLKVELKTAFGTIIVSSNMLSSLYITDKDSIEIVIAKSDNSKLNSSLQTLVGNRPVVDLSIRVNGETINWSDFGAPVVVKIPYNATEEEFENRDHLIVFYLSGDGKTVPIPNATYNQVEKVVEFRTTHFSKYAIAFVNKTFTDLSKNSAMKESIEVLASKGIIEGTTDNLFSPDKSITRGEFLMWLVKTLDITAKYDSNFEDINSTDAYYNAVGLAKALGITSGTGNNKFSPKKLISRQDMIVLTQKALTIANRNLTAGNSDDLKKFSDVSKVSKYALESIATMVKSGYISGSGKKLNPAANTTRAEAAQMLYVMLKK